MRGSPDPYRELGVPRGASDEQVKAAHRRLAKRYHPDAGGGDPVRFLAVQEAYLLLSDPIRRRDWDSQHAPGPVRAAERPVTPRPPATPPSRSSAPPPRRPEDYAGRPPRPTPGAPDPVPGTTASGRDPASRSTTWSAQGVPWWEDFRADGVTRGGGAPTGKAAPAGAAPSGPGAPGGAGATRPPNTPSGTQPPPGPGASQPPLTGTGFSRRPNVAGRAAAGGPPPSAGPGAADVYSRSSGAAWSSAARRHFRKDDADLPRGGAFRYRGTQVVTGAEARRDADAEARRSTMQPPATRPPSAPPRSVPSQPADAAGGAGLMSRLRKLLGGS